VYAEEHEEIRVDFGFAGAGGHGLLQAGAEKAASAMRIVPAGDRFILYDFNAYRFSVFDV